MEVYKRKLRLHNISIHLIFHLLINECAKRKKLKSCNNGVFIVRCRITYVLNKAVEINENRAMIIAYIRKKILKTT